MRRLGSVIMIWVTTTTRSRSQTGQWNFLTNHACVLLTVAQQPDIRISEIADVVGITERATHRILMELVGEGYISVSKNGRRNSYKPPASELLTQSSEELS